ncbi:MAG: hypothetical protein GY749_07615 [Desulfobacteraceae bacterium]|nr:hypothetical protein [Desulfobacteraceae bacterium]
METDQKGDLILKSVPEKNIQKDAARYLARVIKNTPPEKIIAKIREAPCILLKNVPEKPGRRIADDLLEIGVAADFELPAGNAESPEPSQQNDEQKGDLIVKLIPTKTIQEEVVSYLSKVSKKDSPEKIAGKIRLCCP